MGGGAATRLRTWLPLEARVWISVCSGVAIAFGGWCLHVLCSARCQRIDNYNYGVHGVELRGVAQGFRRFRIEDNRGGNNSYYPNNGVHDVELQCAAQVFTTFSAGQYWQPSSWRGVSIPANQSPNEALEADSLGGFRFPGKTALVAGRSGGVRRAVGRCSCGRATQ